MITPNPNRTDILIDQLIKLWGASVRSTHLFLTIGDIDNLTPFVEDGLRQISTLIVYYSDEHPVAFMGIDDAKIEMLFVLPTHFRQGIGQELIALAISEYGVQYVDVNEQNLSAIAFYKYSGFEQFERADFDVQGNPFPILKMKLKSF